MPSFLRKYSSLTGILFEACTQLLLPFLVICSDQTEARRAKNKAARARREERREQKRQDILKSVAKEDEAKSK